MTEDRLSGYNWPLPSIYIVTTALLGALAIKKLAPCLLSRCEKGKAYFSETM